MSVIKYKFAFGSNLAIFAANKQVVTKEEKIPMGDYMYALPNDSIAKYPLPKRDESKLLIYKEGVIEESNFFNLSVFLPENSSLIFNNTRVIHARLPFRKETGASIEIFCLAPVDPVDYQLAFAQTQKCTWDCMVGNLKKWKDGKLCLETELSGKKVKLVAKKTIQNGNTVQVHFTWNHNLTFGELMENLGSIPIPPYLKRESEKIDDTRYQTIYSRNKGSVAAPTAGLHFTDSVLKSLKEKSITAEEVTLHVGAGTFQPVKSDNALEHSMHREFFSVSPHLIKSLAESEGPIISTGTTSLRTLESLYWLALKSLKTGTLQANLFQWEDRILESDIPTSEVFSEFAAFLQERNIDEYHADTQLMIVPGYQFRVAEALITNYHQPGSTLLLLVAAFIGDDWQKVYSYSLKHNFRFLSYGDSSLLWRR